MIEPVTGAVGLLRWLFRPLLNGVRHMAAWFKLFRNASKNLETVERAKSNAEKWAVIGQAQGQGYPICNCSFPPTVMLTAESETHPGLRVWRCASCGFVIPASRSTLPLPMVRAIP